ncbi:MAG TPA: replicative DNA helicase, partial [Victivallales bacterium]|nr:replicative DNA helicase [Victivallales bacterium]
MASRRKNYGSKKEKEVVFVSNADNKTLPNDEISERAVLSAIITEPETYYISSEIFGQEPVFYYPKNQKIYDIITELVKNNIPIDVVNITKLLRDKGIYDEVGGIEYIVQLQHSIASTANIESWCNTLREKALMRKIIKALSIGIEKCYDPEQKASSVIGTVEEEILNAQNFGSKDPIRKMEEIIKSEAFPYIEKILKKIHPEDVIETGFSDLDDVLGGGLIPGEMYVIAARPGVGKTSFALNILCNMALNQPKIPVALFSMEMTAVEIAKRLLYSIAKVSKKDILDPTLSSERRKKLQVEITGAASKFKNVNFFIDPTPALKIVDLKVRAKNLVRKHNVKVIAIDYLQLMHADDESSAESRQIEVSLISGGIKAIAKELNIPVIVLAQLNRQAELQREGKPRASNLRESGSIEQDADVVILLHRDIQKQQNASPEEIENGLDAELIV